MTGKQATDKRCTKSLTFSNMQSFSNASNTYPLQWKIYHKMRNEILSKTAYIMICKKEFDIFARSRQTILKGVKFSTLVIHTVNQITSIIFFLTPPPPPPENAFYITYTRAHFTFIFCNLYLSTFYSLAFHFLFNNELRVPIHTFPTSSASCTVYSFSCLSSFFQ